MRDISVAENFSVPAWGWKRKVPAASRRNMPWLAATVTSASMALSEVPRMPTLQFLIPFSADAGQGEVK